MYTTFHLNSNELDEKFLKSVKAMFKSKRIAITVEDELDETNYLLSTDNNRKELEESIKTKEGFSFTIDELKKHSSSLLKGKEINSKKLRKVKL